MQCTRLTASNRSRASSPPSSPVLPDTMTTTKVPMQVSTAVNGPLVPLTDKASCWMFSSGFFLAWSSAKLKQMRSLGALVEPLNQNREPADAGVEGVAIDNRLAQAVAAMTVRIRARLGMEISSLFLIDLADARPKLASSSLRPVNLCVCEAAHSELRVG